MTKPRSERWIGFRDANDLPELDGYIRTAEDVREAGQWIFLAVVAKAAPEVLATLESVPGRWGFDDEPEPEPFERWAARWNLTAPWCKAHARATWRYWHDQPEARRAYWMPPDGQSGALVADDGGDGSAPRWLKERHHFDWLVQFQVLGAPFRTVAMASVFTVADTQTVRAACLALASLIELPLRPVRQGRPKGR